MNPALLSAHDYGLFAAPLVIQVWSVLTTTLKTFKMFARVHWS